MKEPYGKAVATRTDPEPWRDGRKGVLQASVGERAGWVLSREKEEIGASRTSKRAEDNTARLASARGGWAPRGQRPHART